MQAAVWLHPPLGCPRKALRNTNLCAAPYLFIHLSCTLGGIKAKEQLAEDLSLWFLEPNMTSARRRLFWGAHWRDMIVPVEMHRTRRFHLPCPFGSKSWSDAVS